MDSLAGLPVAREEQFTVPPEEVVGSSAVDLELKSPEYLGLVDADVLFEPLHLLLVEGLDAHCLAGDHAVQGVAEVLDTAVHVLYFGGEQVAGGQDQEAVVAEVGPFMEEPARDVKS